MTDAQAALAQVREALAVGPTPGPWHHCQPFQSVRAERTIHGPVPAQRVDFVSTKTQPVHERIIIPMAGREAHVRSEDMAFIAACNPENIAALLAHVEAQAAEIERLTAERDELRDVLLRNGFVPCDIPACNCGSWHHRYGLPERMQEIKDALAEAGHELSNANGNLPINALKALVAERDDLRRQLDPMGEYASADELIAALHAEKAEDDAMKLDARRYRWIAGHCRSTSEHWGGRWSIIVDGPAPKAHDSEDAFDAAIDAAMRLTRPAEE